jgi:hypothetical protein
MIGGGTCDFFPDIIEAIPPPLPPTPQPSLDNWCLAGGNLASSLDKPFV